MHRPIPARLAKNRHRSVAPSKFACPSCAKKTTGQFCGHCGQQQVTERDYSVRHYAQEIVAAVTLLESKAFRSVWFVISRPGFLSSEYFRGRRVRYVKPLQLFVVLNVLYYFSITLFYATTFTTPLATQLHGNNYYPNYATSRVQQKLQNDHVSYDALESKYNARTAGLSKTLVFLLIPIFALLFYALFFRQRKYLVEHVVAATHFWAFNLLLLGAILPLITVVLLWTLGKLHIPAAFVVDDRVSSASLQVCIAVYLYLMLRKFYGTGRWYGGATASLIAWSFFHIVWLYRFLLFEITLRTV